MEKILQLAASLPPGSKSLDDLTDQFIKLLWENLEHPPLSYQGDEYKYRTADGGSESVTASTGSLTYPNVWVRLTRVGNCTSSPRRRVR